MSNGDMSAEYKAAKAKAKALRPWYKKKRFWFLVFVALATVSAATSKQSDPLTSSNSNQSTSTATKQSTSTATNDQSAVDSTSDQSSSTNETLGEKNARLKAADYLSFDSFSRSGLIKQLEFEGFTIEESTYGVDSQNADWDAEAVKKAADYLQYDSFSHSGLVDQLEFDGFTATQAEYGVTSSGL